MLYYFLTQFSHQFIFFNLFNYLTFRSGGAIMTALVIAFAIGTPLIRKLKSLQGEGQPIRDDGPETHFKKRGTPTMGGALILISFGISTLLWARLDNPYVWICLLVIFGFAAVGFFDDYAKLTKRSHNGIPGKLRLLIKSVIALIAAWLVVHYSQNPEIATGLALPFFKNSVVQMGFLYYFFAAFVMVGTANAVNITDGLDGLAIGPVMIALGCFGIIIYLVSNAVFANYLQLHFVRGSGEVAVLCGALIGASLGFLWYNAPPAMVFMGDTGSLSAGGALGIMAVIAKHEIVLAVIGGLFVMETLSVMIQVVSFKLTGKRVFKMAPIHHHFEKLGWAETTVVMRFWIIAIILALVGLSTLKLR
ncbi:MAG: mraY [Alphaproteobacteria bacterium]|nr:mraY [Alphaproteobacteria bacterium]